MEKKGSVHFYDTWYITSKEQAIFILHHIYSTYTWENLLAMASQWVDMMPQPIVHTFDAICKEMPETDYWLLGCEEKPFTAEKDLNTQKAFMMLILCQFADQCWQLFGKDVHEGKSVNWDFHAEQRPCSIMKDLTQCQTLRHALNIMYECLVVVTGSKYVERMLKKLKKFTPETEQEYKQLRAALKPARFADLVVVYGHYKCLLAAIYFLMGTVEEPLRPAA